MGTVWLARHETIGRDVAIKLLRPQLLAPDIEARFAREAKAAAFVDHPAIVKVFDFGHAEDGRPFIVMEPFQGESLLARLQRTGPLSPREAVLLMLPIVDALSHAHEKGVVHRDVKPDNIFLALKNGQITPKMLDFGIAKLPRRESQRNLTRRGMVLGTASYMAPEQARGLLDVDYRTDIWATCIVLYEMISGTVPFKGDTFHACLRSIVEDDIPPLNREPSDDALWAILRRGLAKDRRERCPSMRELGDGLATWLKSQGPTEEASGAYLAKTWAGREGAFANGLMESPSMSATQPILPLVSVKRAPSVVLSQTEIAALQRRRFPVGAAVFVAAALSIAGIAWAVGSPSELGGVARAAMNTVSPAGASRSVTAPIAETPAPAVHDAPSSATLGMASANAAVSAAARRNAAAALVPPKPAAPALSSSASAGVVPVVLDETATDSGGWIHRALVGGAAPARAHDER
jgi:serine/threonine-protein kinase